MVGSDTKIVMNGFRRRASWVGRSGRSYDLQSENLDHFAMTERDLYLIAKGGNTLWVGSTNDLVVDPLSRTRFRLALDCGDRVFRVISQGMDAERLSTIWDLEGAEPMAGAQAA